MLYHPWREIMYVWFVTVLSLSGCIRTNENELRDLQGTWQVIAIRDNGKLVPPEKIKGSLLVFSADKLKWMTPDGKCELEYRVDINSQEDPDAIDLISIIDPDSNSEETIRAIFELKNDSLRICLPQGRVERRPISFTADLGSHTSVITLKRLNQ